MSSSNRVRIAAIEESEYGKVPIAGDFSQLRFTSEALSGTPDTVESEQIRVDRMSSGQITVGLSNLGGDVNFELAKEALIEKFMASAMMKNWVTPVPVTELNLSIDATAQTITRDSGDWNDDISVGDMLVLNGFANEANNVEIMVTAINSTTEIKYTMGAPLVNESYDEWVTDEAYEVGDKVFEDGKIYICMEDHTSGTFATDLAATKWEEERTLSYKLADYLTIGTDAISFSMEKAFLDLEEKGIVYKGMIVNQMSLAIAYGALITGSFGFVGNDYKVVKQSSDFITDSRTIAIPATSQTMNGSVDMPFVVSELAGELDKANFCIQEVGLSINNNNTPKNCIGRITPSSYTEGQTSIEVNLSSYLSDENWELLDQKLNQTPFGLGFAVKNSGGFYGFYLPSVQVSMDDPSSGGRNQDVILSMSGMAKVGDKGESALKIFRA